MSDNTSVKVYRYLVDGSFDKEYVSLRDAAKDNGGVESVRHNIKRACNLGIKCSGYLWSYNKTNHLFTKDGIDELKRIKEIESEFKESCDDLRLKHLTKIPAVLLIDTETLPLQVYTWHTSKQRINHNQIIEDFCLVSWSAKWLFEAEMYSDVLTPKEAVRREDKRICQSLWKLLEKADVVCGHNLIKFDNRKINGRFLLNDIKPPSPYQFIDTLKESQKAFGFSSHRLDYLGQIFVEKQKIKTDFELWIRCCNGEENALQEMVTYNEEDVRLLEDVYVKIRPYIKSHPNLALYAETEDMICPNCGGNKLTECGVYTTMLNQYESLRCDCCGAVSRKRTTIVSASKNKRLLVSNAR